MIRPGTYLARIEKGSIAKAENSPAVMVWFTFVTEDHQRIRGSQCLQLKDGSLSTKTIDTLREVLGWDGVDGDWLNDAQNYADVDVEIVCEAEEYVDRNGETKETVKVRWINKPGGGGARDLPQPMSAREFASTLGAKLRAYSGSPAKPRTPTKTPPSRAAKALPTPPPSRVSSRPLASSKEEAWAVCTSVCSDPEADWFTAIDAVAPGASEDQITPEQWAQIKAQFDDVAY